ncbi:MAG: hypothetical protein L3J41_10750 [Melioribacteraceae bacterium]|nr:hypothetical protein [Melioribacteraceae bacterium]
MRGFIGLESNYYHQNTLLKTGFREVQNSSQFNGSFSLDTKSNILHPNFLEIELNALFRPGTRNDNFIVAPDQAAVTTAERIALRTNLFNTKPLSGSFFYNYDHSFVRRDFATNIENFRKNIGAYVNFRSYFAKMNFNYNFDDWLQNELDLNRFYASKIHNFETSISQSFSRSYDNKLTLNYADYSRVYSYNNLIIANKTFDANLNTKFLFNIPTPVRYYSFISYNNQVGYDDRNKMNIQQSLNSQLPYNLSVNASYSYNYLKVNLFTSNVNSANFTLNHQLFSSLSSFINYEYTNYKQDLFSESTKRFQVGFSYSKIIPGGNVNLSYTYGGYNKSSESLTSVNSIFGEGHKLTDGNIELLNNPNIFENTIVVTDIENVVVYQEGFDYQIIEYGEFFEIRRLLGGQISNDGFVLVNYDYSANNSYKYNSPTHNYFAGINLFDNFIQLSYSGSEVTYNNLENAKYLLLKLVSQRILSLKFNYSGFSTGIEFNSFESNIVPYEFVNYFGQYDYLQKNFALFSFRANYKRLLLIDQNQRQIFMTVVGRLMFFLSKKTKLLLESSYQFQEGVGIDLNLLKFKTEYQANFRALKILVGVELYDRNYIQEDRKYLNGYITIQRSF